MRIVLLICVALNLSGCDYYFGNGPANFDETMS